MKRRWNAFLLALALAAGLWVPAEAAEFADVPPDSALGAEVSKAVQYGLMNGYSAARFGYGDAVTRAQFATIVGRMLGWGGDAGAVTAEMALPDTLSDAYRAAIGAAAAHDAVDSGAAFRPADAITRGEMSELLVRALGLKSAAALAEKQGGLPFTDVTERTGYISVARAIGMANGVSETAFAPDATATRAQAAAMLVRVYEKINRPPQFIHGFYAISSYSQLHLTDQMDAVSAGWSRMTWDGLQAKLSTTSDGHNEYAIPDSYQLVTNYLDSTDKPLHLSVYMDTSGGLRELLASQSGRAEAVEAVLGELTRFYDAIGKNPYAGVTIDFEGLRSAQRENYTAFLTELSQKVHGIGKKLFVTVQPVLTTGSYYDGYDYRAIGALADRVILMAHDYDPLKLTGFTGSTYYQTAAPAPIDQVYASLLAALDPDTGVEDTGKLALAVSWKAVAWETDGEGALTGETPVHPALSTVSQRLRQPGTVMGWSDTYQMPYLRYATEEGQNIFLWYEDARSVAAKVRLAELLGIRGVSLWRLGNLPDDSGDGLYFNVMDALR